MTTTETREIRKTRYVLAGSLATVLLLAWYFGIVSIFSGFPFAIDNFMKLWYWMIPLAAGFGIQMGLFFYVRAENQFNRTGNAAASAGISTLSMVACCVHHIADIVPFLGIAAFGLFMAKYQPLFLIVGILSNVLGITFLMGMPGTKVPAPAMKKAFYGFLAVSVVIVFASFAFLSSNGDTPDAKRIGFGPLTDSRNSITFTVTPINAGEYQVRMETHSVDMGFDPAKISALYDSLGVRYEPLGWEGSPPGGHHREGILQFPPVDPESTSVRLVITDSTPREFSWNLG